MRQIASKTIYATNSFCYYIDMTKTQEGQSYAVLIGDVIDSRERADQTAMIKTISDATARVNALVEPIEPLRVTIGDEFQGTYSHLRDALEASLLVRLVVGTSLDLRFGIGWGRIESFDPEQAPLAQSGPAWWRAREAIDLVKNTVGKRRWPKSLRTQAVGNSAATLAPLNALLICRDALLMRMDEKDLRITLGLFQQERQEDIGAELGISQPSVARRQVENGPTAVYRAHQVLIEMA